MLDLFKTHKNKSHIIKDPWQSIGRDLELDISIEELKTKHSDPKKEYRKRQIENKRSGNEAYK